ncbi:MAG: SDR family NAD(P)-dependent oxidoreductase [Phycicoccus sp.]
MRASTEHTEQDDDTEGDEGVDDSEDDEDTKDTKDTEDTEDTEDTDQIDDTEDAVVVGATGAVGSELVRMLAGRGLRVVAVARDADALARLASSVDGEVVPCPTDIGTNDAVGVIRSALRARVRIAVLAAGLPMTGSVESVDPDLLAAGAQVKVAGVVRLLHAVRGSMAAGSRFVAVAGTLGLEPGRDEAGPGAVNAGLVNLMKQIALGHGADGITVHTLAPGPMDTPRLRRIAASVAEERGLPADDVWAGYEARVPLGRLPRVDELVWAVRLVLDPEADILHGTVLHLDGGALHAPH